MPPELPSLVAVAAGAELARLTPPAAVLLREPWALGVLSIEVEREGRHVAGKLRAAVTGRSGAVVTAIAPDVVVHMFVHHQGAAPELPDPPVPRIGGGVLGGCAVFLDGRPLTVALLEGRYAYDHPPPRAIGQVYCRWLRGGAMEFGCEQTDFRSTPAGLRAPRLISRFVEPRSVLSFVMLGA